MIVNPHDKRSNLLDMTKNFKSFLAPEEVYPGEFREDMLIELFIKSQARSGGAQYNFETMSLLWSSGEMYGVPINIMLLRSIWGLRHSLLLVSLT